MRIVIATTTGFHLRRLAKELHDSGLNTRYISYAPRQRLRRDGMGKEWSTSLFVPLLPGSFAAQFRYLPRLQNQAVFSMMKATDDYLADNLPPCDIYIGLSSMAIRSARAAKERFGATVIIERASRHVLSQQQLLQNDKDGGLSSYYIERELESYAEADYISVLSGHARDSFVDRGFDPSRLFCNPLGVDLNQFQPTSRPDGPLKLLFVGAWSYRKGVDLLVAALKQRPDWALTHVGLNSRANMPESSQVLHVGHLTHSDLSTLMSKHHILVLPSREDGFGMVLLEGLAAGLPLVASQLTGGPDSRDMISAKHFVGIAKPGDAADLLRVLDEMEKCEAASASDRQRLTPIERESISWKGYGERYRIFLERISALPSTSLVARS